MKHYNYIFWDLDGTISDSAFGIVNATAYALEHMGTKIGDREQLKKFVGPPLLESFGKYFGYTSEQSECAVNLFRDYYQRQGINENWIYPGVEELLRKLQTNGHINVIATSKPEVHARTILERYSIDGYFHYIAGSTFDETRTRKDEVIAYALETCGITDPTQVVMVGDRSHDCVGARLNGMDCIGVLYGYGNRNELEEAGAFAIAEDIHDLTKLLLR